MFHTINQLFTFSQNVLNICAKRQEILSSNIANADTPGYKSMDINFEHELNKITHNQNLQKTLPRKLYNNKNIIPSYNLVPVISNEIKKNGNTVDMDRERIEFINNSLKYESCLVLLNNEIKNMTHVLRG